MFMYTICPNKNHTYSLINLPSVGLDLKAKGIVQADELDNTALVVFGKDNHLLVLTFDLAHTGVGFTGPALLSLVFSLEVADLNWKVNKLIGL